jgi:hypothetical protein
MSVVGACVSYALNGRLAEMPIYEWIVGDEHWRVAHAAAWRWPAGWS